MGEKSMKGSLFYFIYPANSNSGENSGILKQTEFQKEPSYDGNLSSCQV